MSSKLDVYLRSIERFGAAGAVLTSGQAVTLKFPAGDRQATQVTPHDQLVLLVREVAPPAALDHIDQQRPVRFEVDSQGTRYAITVTPRPGSWSVGIEPSTSASPAPSAPSAPPRAGVRAPTPAPVAGDEMEIERGQYDGAAPSAATVATSGSTFLDQLTTSARGQRATDVYLAVGAPPLIRTAGALTPGDRGALDSEMISRELGLVAPAEARGAWADNRLATFAYGDGAGRVRVTLGRDHRGPTAALRLLHGEAPPLDRLGLPRDVTGWLDGAGLVLVAGPSGSGRTTLVAALVRAIGERGRVVVALEDPIEIVHTGSAISQRAIGDHVGGYVVGVEGARREGVDAIAIGAVSSPDAADAVLDAVAGGHLVVAAISAPGARGALDHLLGATSASRRDLARTVCGGALLGTISPVVSRSGRSYEVVPGTVGG